MQSSPLSRILVSNPGAGRPKLAAPVLGLIGLVTIDQQHAARLGHPQHVVPQFGIGGPNIRRHDRVQIPLRSADRSRSAKLGWRVKMRDARSETVGDVRADGLQQIQGLARHRWRSSTPGSTRRAMVASRPNAKPPIQKNGELQNKVSEAVSPRISLRLRWCPSSPAWVCTAPLGGAGRAEV